MAILFESNWLENQLKSELIRQGINFEEQKHIYEKGDYFFPKYVVDFYLVNGSIDLIVECDGISFHSSDKDKKNGTNRDKWLKLHGYKNIVHFTSNQIKYDLDIVIKIIKHKLGLQCFSKSEMEFKKRKEAQFVVNVSNENLHDVELFYQYITTCDRLFLVYKFRDNSIQKVSEERIINVCNVPDKLAGELSLYLALKDLKKPVKLIVYCCSQWLTNFFNKKVHCDIKTDVLIKIEKILKNHNYIFRYLNTTRNSSYYYKPQDERLITQELMSRCRQQCYAKQTKEFVSFQSLIQ